MSDHKSHLTCPRCDHVVDAVAGTVAGGTTGSAGGPTPTTGEGTCSECGLVFRWEELREGAAYAPRWLFEHARGFLGEVLAIPVTFVTILLPWVLWTRLKLVHPIRGSRCVALALMGVVGLWFILGSVMAISVGVLLWRDSGRQGVMDVERQPTVKTTYRIWIPASDATLAVSSVFFYPIGVDSLSVTMVYEPVSSIDVATQAPVPLPPTRQFPLTLNSYIDNQIWSVSRGLLLFGIYWTLAACSSVATFIVLPIARKRAKVSWRHIGRCSAYLVAAMTPMAAVGTLVAAFMPSLAASIQFALLAPIALIVFWFAATKFYLKMQRSIAVALSVGVVGSLAAITIVVVAWQAFAPPAM